MKPTTTTPAPKEQKPTKKERRSRRECKLARAVEQVLRASEDGGGMSDIDFEQLREALK